MPSAQLEIVSTAPNKVDAAPADLGFGIPTRAGEYRFHLTDGLRKDGAATQL